PGLRRGQFHHRHRSAGRRRRQPAQGMIGAPANAFSRARRRASIGQRETDGGSDMDLGMTPKVKPLVEKVRAMVREEIMPLEEAYEAEVGKGDRWTYTKQQEEIREGLKAKARERGLWNFWLT